MKKMVFLVSVFGIATGMGTGLAAVGGGDVTLVNKGGNVTFSHELHVNGAGLECTACHDKLYLSRAQHKTVTMKQMQKGKSCGACHDGKKAFSVKGDCAKCHRQ